MPKTMDFKKRIELVAKGYDDLHEKYNVDATIIMRFPQQKIPLLARLAMKILAKYNATFNINLTDRKK